MGVSTLLDISIQLTSYKSKTKNDIGMYPTNNIFFQVSCHRIQSYGKLLIVRLDNNKYEKAWLGYKGLVPC